ncbi:MAG TPA: ATP-binding protein [Verrucomicrobiae bacterium]
MTQPHQSSIKSKLMTVIMLASITVLLMTVVAFMFYDLVTFRQNMERNLSTEARIIAENSTASLAFKNENDAASILASLRNEPHIIAAAIYDAQGNLFVKYPAHLSAAALPRKPQNPGYEFQKSHLTIFEPVIQAGVPLGTIFLRSDLTALAQRLELYGAISLLIMLGSLLVAFWLSNTLQRRISDPIIVLAETARKISEQRDYSLRAPKLSDDELGLLTDSFNEMLERIQASDQALRASEAQFRLVTDQAPVLLAHMDRNYHYKFVNQTYAERYGLKPENIVGKHAAEVVGLELFERARPYIDKALAGFQIQFELEVPDAHRERRWNHVEYTPEKNSEGEVVGFVAVHTDITARKRTELEMERTRDQALAASRAKDDFLAALSHELRTPLNPVLLVASDAAEDPQLPAPTRANFEMIRRNVELEARLIDDLLDLTRITRGKLSLEKRSLDVREVLREAIATVRADAEKKRIVLTQDGMDKECLMAGDSVRLQQIFWNVLKNAVKFTPEGGKISVETRASENGKIIVQVTDTGIGLTAEEISHVFDTFAQGDHADPNGSHRFGGLGLGLAISRMLVELHAGVIRAASAGRDRGATFTIELPCLPTAEKNNLASSVPEKTGATISQKKNFGLRILLIEDHEPTRTTLAHLLTRRNYKVKTANSVADARAIAQKETFDLVVSDIGLPDGNGYELMAELRDQFHLKGIALTGYGMDRDVAAAQSAGFVAHLTKPIRVESLEKALLDAT